MNSEQENRLQLLSSGPCTPGEYIHEYYGCEWPLRADTAALLLQFRGTLRRSVGCLNNELNRYELEGFFSRGSLLPKKWMGARLGMTLESLDELLGKLDTFGMQPARYAIGAEFIAEGLSEDLLRYVPALRFRTFGSHNFFCERLHVELQKAVGIQVKPLFCATSTRLQEYPRRYAMYFDCLTLEPLSAGHSAWLDFRKPLNLGPDRCSKLFYLENRGSLIQFNAGRTEPDGLDTYEQFLAGGQHA